MKCTCRKALHGSESMFFHVHWSVFRLPVREKPSLIVTSATLLRVAEYKWIKELLFAVSSSIVKCYAVNEVYCELHSMSAGFMDQRNLQGSTI